MKKAYEKKPGKAKRGMQFACSECGMVVSVVDPCGCVGVCDLHCCGMPMKKVRKTNKMKRRR